MKYLVDEQMSVLVVAAMKPFGAALGEEWLHIDGDLGRGGTLDPEIPPLCAREGVSVLVTMNVRDFGARKHYYASLIDHGVHVVVVRPGKQQPNAGQQLGLVAQHHASIRRQLTATAEPSLIVVTHGAARLRTLGELLQEIQGLP